MSGIDAGAGLARHVDTANGEDDHEDRGSDDRHVGDVEDRPVGKLEEVDHVALPRSGVLLAEARSADESIDEIAYRPTEQTTEQAAQAAKSTGRSAAAGRALDHADDGLRAAPHGDHDVADAVLHGHHGLGADVFTGLLLLEVEPGAELRTGGL